MSRGELYFISPTIFYNLTLILVMSMLPSTAYPHQLSTAYFDVKGSSNLIHGQLQVSLYDLQFGIGIDSNRDGKVTWGELQENHFLIISYLQQKMSFSSNEQLCDINFDHPLKIDEHFNVPFAAIPITVSCLGVKNQSAPDINFSYSAFHEINDNHKLLMTINRNVSKSTSTSRILDASKTELTFNFNSSSVLKNLKEYIYQGIIHIWIGIDHIAFLLCLLITCVLKREKDDWKAQGNLKRVWSNTLIVVTTFTIAHSITLTLASFDLFNFSSKWIEVAIAVTIVFAALNNVITISTKILSVTFAFGLIHGMGFSNVLLELGLPDSAKFASIIGFNIGVEIGQIIIVLVLVPILASLRFNDWYIRHLRNWVSISIAFLGCYWIIARV